MSLGAAKVACAALLGLAIAGPALADDAPPPRAAPVDDTPVGAFRCRAFGAGDGLRNLIILSITQDGDGMLWVATDDGVYRYDGQVFTHYSMQHGLPAMGVRVLGVAPDGAVCGGTRDGMACWNGMAFTPDGAEGLPKVSIQALVAAPGVLWAGTTSGLVVRRGNAAFVPAPGWPAADHPVRAIWADAEGIVVGDGAGLRVGS